MRCRLHLPVALGFEQENSNSGPTLYSKFNDWAFLIALSGYIGDRLQREYCRAYRRHKRAWLLVLPFQGSKA